MSLQQSESKPLKREISELTETSFARACRCGPPRARWADPFFIGRKYIGQNIDELGAAAKSRRSLFDDRVTSREHAVEHASHQDKNYKLCYCGGGCLGPLFRIGATLFSVCISFTPAFVRLFSGGTFFGNGDGASAIFMTLTVVVCVIVYGSFALVLLSGIQGSQASWLLVTMLMALPKRETDRVRREREAMPDGLGRLSLTNAASLDAFMSLRKVVLTEVRQVLVSLERSQFQPNSKENLKLIGALFAPLYLNTPPVTTLLPARFG